MKNYVKRPSGFGWRTVANWASQHGLNLGEHVLIAGEEMVELDTQYNDELIFNLIPQGVWDGEKRCGSWGIIDARQESRNSGFPEKQVRTISIDLASML